MFKGFKEAFRKVSWSGFMSVLLAIVSAVAVVFFGNFTLATYLILCAVYFVLVSFRDEP